MKKTSLAVAVFVFAISIVLPVVASGNHFADNQMAGGTLAADGWPLPPGNASGTLVADGWPLPPGNASGTLVADGWPLPPASTFIMA